MLVVADEAAVRVGRQGGLACAGQAEEDGAVAVLADVGGAVHREDVLLGHEVVHHGEDALLDFARIAAAGDDGHALFEVDDDGRFAVHAVAFGNALIAGARNHGEAGHERVQFFLVGADQQLMDEHVFAGKIIHHAHGQTVFRIGAGKAVEHEHVAVLQIGANAVIDVVEFFLADRHVDLAPGDGIMMLGLIHDVAVERAAAGVRAGLDQQRAGIGQAAFAQREGLLGQISGGFLIMNLFGIDNTDIFEVFTDAILAHNSTSV